MRARSCAPVSKGDGVYGGASGGPEARGGGAEEGEDRGSDGGGEVGDAGIVADVDAGSAEAAGEIVEVVGADGVGEMFFGSAEPFDGHFAGEAVGGAFKEFHGGTFGLAAGERMDDGYGSGHRGAGNYREAGCGRFGLAAVELYGVGVAGGEGAEEAEGKAGVRDQVAEVGAVGAVPGDDGVEGAEAFEDVVGGEEAEAVESGGDDGAGGIGEAGEGDVLLGAPDFRVIGGVSGAEGFHGGKADDEVADGAWPDQKTSHPNLVAVNL